MANVGGVCCIWGHVSETNVRDCSQFNADTTSHYKPKMGPTKPLGDGTRDIEGTNGRGYAEFCCLFVTVRVVQTYAPREKRFKGEGALG